MDWRKLEDDVPVLVRVSISLLLLWFGITQILNPTAFIGYAPAWATNLSFIRILLLLQGIGETALGTVLLLGIYTRIAALLATLHIAGIALVLGYNDVAIRDYALALVAFSVFLHGPDKWCWKKLQWPK